MHIMSSAEPPGESQKYLKQAAFAHFLLKNVDVLNSEAAFPIFFFTLNAALPG